MSLTKDLIDLTDRYSAHNYSPLDIVIRSASGSWVMDVDGKRYLDMLSAYSALNFGHLNPRIVAAAQKQLSLLTLTSRAFYSEEFALLCKELASLCRKDKVLLMNSGAEAVETAIKACRKWGYEIKGIDKNKAEIICFSDNFHGRTTTIVGFSSSASAYKNFGPFGEGFKILPYGDINAVESEISKNTTGILVEPIQGEGGVIIPPDGYLKKLRQLCSDKNILLIADEIQTGLCRTGEIFACDHEKVEFDIVTIGKSLGGGIVPISAVAANDEIMNVFTPGTHGSTFGGNPFACAIAREVVALINETTPHKTSKELGDWLLTELRKINSSIVSEIRGRGLFIGIDIDKNWGKAKKACQLLKEHGVLCKDTREQTIRLAPPLTIAKKDLEFGLEKIKISLSS